MGVPVARRAVAQEGGFRGSLPADGQVLHRLPFSANQPAKQHVSRFDPGIRVWWLPGGVRPQTLERWLAPPFVSPPAPLPALQHSPPIPSSPHGARQLRAVVCVLASLVVGLSWLVVSEHACGHSLVGLAGGG